MKSIRALIIDDERSARLELSRMLEDYPMITVLGEAANADEAEEMIRRLKPDLLFLDIQMPGRSGFELLESLEWAPLVIFITAYDTYAVKAFEVSALDYLMKPVREERFAKAVDQIQRRFMDQLGRGADQLGRGADQSGPDADQSGPGVYQAEPSVFVKDGGRYHLIKWKEVHLIESMDNYAKLFFGRQHVLLKSSLNQLEEKLDSNMFFRTGRAQMINLHFIESIFQEDSRLSVRLTTGELIMVSSRQAVRFKSMNRR